MLLKGGEGKMKRLAIAIVTLILSASFIVIVYAVGTAPSVKDDPLVRMPGTQPDQGVNLEAPRLPAIPSSGPV